MNYTNMGIDQSTPNADETGSSNLGDESVDPKSGLPNHQWFRGYQYNRKDWGK